MTDLFATIPEKAGKANGEFVAHLIEVREGRRDMAWLRKTCPNVSREIARANLKFWGIIANPVENR